jgi:hypothetical protein
MTPSKILCRFEPGRFPEREFAHDEQGNLILPYIHIARQPIHYILGTLVPEHLNPGGAGNLPGGPPVLPTMELPTYFTVVPALADQINRALERFLAQREHVTLEDIIAFGVKQGLTPRNLNLEEIIESNLRGIPREALGDPEKYLQYFLTDHPPSIDPSLWNKPGRGILPKNFRGGPGRGGFGGGSAGGS